MRPAIHIGGRRIGADAQPYVVAELSANHNGELATALKIIDAAKRAGADAVKLQTYRPDTITLDCDADDFRITGGLWDGRTLFDLYAEAHMPWEWHQPLFAHARKIGITIFSSPFDNSAIDLLETLDAPAYKIASFEAVDLPLIEYAASTGKPLIISTGMANADEIEEAVGAARRAGCTELALLRCVSGYPAPAADYNLRTIPDMARRFGVIAGLSDHTRDNSTAIAAVALGAAIVEKHVTLDRRAGGPDDSFSLEPAELAGLCRDLSTAWQALGGVSYECRDSERAGIKFRRSLYAVADIRKGEEITLRNVRSIRPGLGLPPKYLGDILGRRAAVDIAFGAPIGFGLLE